ncbi:MAG: Preprotein translocase, SecG subunit [candidate division WS6 bacterium GW2011_GWA2_37_6]|uniref:Protein-export membrane protein SecG n=1 Tax=candidate division WS6 bacterium GW2011_GWA2_37_6 TaxID=1619087 RepID=A0A0G0GUL7_9BACT|nr:MAG: Preprotein translocase, SecG subunit [candidate division WS6 bacterium GW2011_GWA2_37_6]
MSTIQILSYIEIALSAGLLIVILLQQGGSGLGTIFGGSGGESYRSKRGVEALLYRVTVLLIVLFIADALAIAVIGSK